MSTPRLMALSQPKVVNDPSLNNQFANTATDGTKPLWRTTRKLHGEAAQGASGLPTVYPKAVNYHEERFGWRSGFWTMWDTEPNGTQNAIREAPDHIKEKAAFTAIRPRAHDDPTRMRLFPTAHTTTARLASAHEAWDARSSKAWQDIVEKEKSTMQAAARVTPRKAAPTHGPVLPGRTTCHTARLRSLATPGHRPAPPLHAKRPRSINGRANHAAAWSPGNTSPRVGQAACFGAYVSSAVH